MNLAASKSQNTLHGGADSVASQLAMTSDADRETLETMMQNATMDAFFLDGLSRHLDQAAAAPFINALKLEKLGLWVGSTASARLQVRLMEISKSSLHPAYAAFRAGLVRSGGLQKAYPPAAV